MRFHANGRSGISRFLAQNDPAFVQSTNLLGGRFLIFKKYPVLTSKNNHEQRLFHHYLPRP